MKLQKQNHRRELCMRCKVTHVYHFMIAVYNKATLELCAIPGGSVNPRRSLHGNDSSKHDREAEEIVSWVNPMYLGTVVL